MTRKKRQIDAQMLRDMGYALCEQCETIMEPDTDSYGNLIYRCPECGWTVLQDDFESNPDDELDYDTIYENEDIYIPEGCLACGGPYPDCKTSCPLFDD